jgi:succinyl-CoA synthetase alpha subunit/RimJ/RimL family protein N-acetyltransferase
MFAAAGESERLVRDVLLRDGSTLRLQAPTSADFDDITEFLDGLSAESRCLRFHGYGRTDIAARAAAGGGGVDRVALIARYGGRVVAVAGFDGLREPRAAEISFAVADDFRGRRAGTRMLEQLAAIAADRGINRFDAEVMSANGAMLDVFEGAGFAVRRRSWLGKLTVSLEITPSEAVLERIDERDHFAAVASLRALLAPSSIAVVGAAATPRNVGRAVLANIVAGDFQGPATPVNRAGSVVCSRRAARSLAELEIAAELVIITAAGDEVLEFAAEAAANGARALLVLPTGLEDDGVASLERHEQLLEIVRGSGLRIVGPGSLGVVNTAAEVRLNATFSGARVRAGALAIGAQAVAPGLGLLGHAEARQMGISILVSVGGRADVSTNDLLEWCEADDRTAVVMLYVESFGNPERFARVAQRVSRRKPILVCQGASQRGACAQPVALSCGDGAAWRCGNRRGVASSRGAAGSQQRGAVPRRSAVREPAAAERSADRDREQLGECGNPRFRRVRSARAGGERRARSAVSGAVGARRWSARVRRAGARVARRRRHRCAGGLLCRPSRGRPGGHPRGGLRGLGGAAQARCGIGRALRRAAARKQRPGRAELPVPGVVCGRARARGRASRMALAAARRAPALSRPGRDGGVRADRFIS